MYDVPTCRIKKVKVLLPLSSSGETGKKSVQDRHHGQQQQRRHGLQRRRRRRRLRGRPQGHDRALHPQRGLVGPGRAVAVAAGQGGGLPAPGKEFLHLWGFFFIKMCEIHEGRRKREKIQQEGEEHQAIHDLHFSLGKKRHKVNRTCCYDNFPRLFSRT